MDLQARLFQNHALSPKDEAWLDDAASLVNERYAFDTLSKAPDYDAALKKLTLEQWDVEGWLIQLAEAAAGNEGENGKWKHMSFVAICENKKLSVSHTGPVNPKTTAGQPKSKKPVHVSGKTYNATLHKHIEVLDWHCSNGQNQLKTACHFADVYPKIGTVTDKNIAYPCDHPLFPRFWLCTWTYSYTLLYDI